jgi:hypothetical protein
VKHSEDEQRSFFRLWETIPSSHQARVKNLATSGERAPDPETAWLVLMWADQQMRRIWRWSLPMSVLLVGVFVWAVFHVGPWALPLLLYPLLAIGSLVVLWRLGRAVRANEPIAEAPVGAT